MDVRAIITRFDDGGLVSTNSSGALGHAAISIPATLVATGNTIANALGYCCRDVDARVTDAGANANCIIQAHYAFVTYANTIETIG